MAAIITIKILKTSKKRNLSDKEIETLNNGLRILAKIIARDMFEKNKDNLSGGKDI